MGGHPRGRKVKPGSITFVGSGPGDPGLLTTRARAVLANAACVFTDPDVPEAVLGAGGQCAAVEVELGPQQRGELGGEFEPGGVEAPVAAVQALAMEAVDGQRVAPGFGVGVEDLRVHAVVDIFALELLEAERVQVVAGLGRALCAGGERFESAARPPVGEALRPVG